MSPAEKHLLETLVQLEDTVRTMATAQPKPDLRPIFAELDRVAVTLPKGTDPQLLHYLQKKSYQKARLWLEGREAQNQPGACGHVE